MLNNWREGMQCDPEELERLWELSQEPVKRRIEGVGVAEVGFVFGLVFCLASAAAVGWAIWKFVGWAVAAIQ
jgi:hypothetical protein